MRWILVFVILYAIPLTVIFKNYKRLSRACVYSGIYVVLATTIVISNMYISSIDKIEKDIKASTSTDYDGICISTFEISDSQEDLTKINIFKRDIRDIEAVAIQAFKECMSKTNEMEISMEGLKNIEKDIDKAKYMCEAVIDGYKNLKPPTLSKREYNEALEECVIYMKEAYEIRYEIVLDVDKMLKQKNISYLPKIKKNMDEANKKINQYKNKIYCLEKLVEGK